MNNLWGELAGQHWQYHLRRAELENPDGYFAALEPQATVYYLAIRDRQLEGVNCNNSAIIWADFVDRVAWANQTACEIVRHKTHGGPDEDRGKDGADDIDGTEL